MLLLVEFEVHAWSIKFTAMLLPRCRRTMVLMHLNTPGSNVLHCLQCGLLIVWCDGSIGCKVK